VKVISHTYEMMERAYQRASGLGILKNSIMNGDGNYAGYMGEETVASYLGADIVSDHSSSHDLVKDGIRIEVKTKRRTVSPIGTYEVSVAATSAHQKPDLYAFVSLQYSRAGIFDERRVYEGLECVWLLGYKNPEDYFREARLLKPGDVDSDNNFRAAVDMFNLPIHRLDPGHDISI